MARQARQSVALLALILAASASVRAQAEGLAVLPSLICQAPLAEEFDSGRPGTGAERWSHAFQDVVNRCQKGDVLLLTRGAQANALRYCDFDGPVQFLPTGQAVCSFAGGVREQR